jgi:hypothetical protein
LTSLKSQLYHTASQTNHTGRLEICLSFANLGSDPLASALCPFVCCTLFVNLVSVARTSLIAIGFRLLNPFHFWELRFPLIFDLFPIILCKTFSCNFHISFGILLFISLFPYASWAPSEYPALAKLNCSQIKSIASQHSDLWIP